MKKKLHWLWALLIQSAAMLLLSLIGALTLYLGSTLHAIVQCTESRPDTALRADIADRRGGGRGCKKTE